MKHSGRTSPWLDLVHIIVVLEADDSKKRKDWPEPGIEPGTSRNIALGEP